MTTRTGRALPTVIACIIYRTCQLVFRFKGSQPRHSPVDHQPSESVPRYVKDYGERTPAATDGISTRERRPKQQLIARDSRSCLYVCVDVSYIFVEGRALQEFRPVARRHHMFHFRPERFSQTGNSPGPISSNQFRWQHPLQLRPAAPPPLAHRGGGSACKGRTRRRFSSSHTSTGDEFVQKTQLEVNHVDVWIMLV